jgi:hypothetical protein
MQCPACQYENPAQAQACAACGVRLPRIASLSSAEADPDQVRRALADKIGFASNVRTRDNVVQAICVAVAGGTGALIGHAVGHSGLATALGLVAGLIVSTLISGLWLMVAGLNRPAPPWNVLRDAVVPGNIHGWWGSGLTRQKREG